MNSFLNHFTPTLNNSNNYHNHQHNPYNNRLPPQTLVLSTHPQNSSLTLLHPQYAPPNSPPLYAINNSTTTKPHITIHRNQSTPASATFHTFSSKTDILLHGSQPLTLKKHDLSASYTLPTHSGKLKWKVNAWTGSGAELSDANGVKIARFTSVKTGSWWKKEKRLEVLVDVEIGFLDLVVVSGFAVRALEKADLEVAGEVVGAVGGAV